MNIFSNEIKNSGFFENWIHTFLQVTQCALSDHAEKIGKKFCINFELSAI